MTQLVKDIILEVSDNELRTARNILEMLRCISYDKMDYEKGERYRAKIDIIFNDIVHFRELL